MDQHLSKLLRSIMESDPEAPIDDDGRRALMYAMLGLHPGEHFPAILEFANSISDEFKRSYLLHNLVTHSAQRVILFDFAERVARTIPVPYWRLSALNHVAAEMLRRDREFGTIKGVKCDLRERAERLLLEIEKSLPSVPEEDRERSDLMWGAAVSMINAGKLEWAENLASCTNFYPENTDVFLRSAKARLFRGEVHHVIRLARIVAELARKGSEDFVNRAYDLESAAELVFECGGREEARQILDEAEKLGLASQESRDIDGSKCLVSIATSFAKHGYRDAAMETAKKIAQTARREDALRRIDEISPSS